MKLLLAIALLVLVLVLVLVPVQWEMSVSGSDSVQCREEERLALLHINASLSFAIHSLDGKWEGMECCRWERVTCNPTTGHVTELDLGMYFHGDDWSDYERGILVNATLFLPLHQLRSLSLYAHGIYNFTNGAGLETWSNLTKLEILDLNDNFLDGSIIYDLAGVPSLHELYLFGNNINNSLPIKGFESWSNLTKLEILDLSENNLPTSIISSLAKVSSLRALYLDFNSIGGNINFPIKELINALNLEVVSLMGSIDSGSSLDLGYCSSLKALSLADNNLNDTSSLEGLCQLKNLAELDLSNNNFSGNLSLCMGNLSSLKLVDLSDNHLEINFPSSIFERLVSLRYLSLSGNQLEGTLSMRLFFNHTNLEFLRLSTSTSNFRVEVVNLPFQLQDLQLANCILDVEPTFLYSQHKLRELDLSNSRSKGHLSDVLWFLLENNPNLITLDLHKNFFTGPLQLLFLTHEKLSELDISNNHLSEELPANISMKLPNLISLNLSKNYFHGPLPLISTNNIYILDLSFNNLTNDIQNNFPRIRPNILSILNLSFNKFYGSFTSSFNFTQAARLLINDNNISGEIPFSICNTSFNVLDLSNNELNGVLPDCIGNARQYHHVYPIMLKLSGNNLEGSLPLEICVAPNLWLLDLSDNKFSGSIPPCSNHSDLQIVDLSQNNLTGNFPLTWLNISNIYSIDIQENHLFGELPSWIGKESTLRMLQARENLFGGPIPLQICQLKYLRILDLSHNNLSGEIPSCIINMGSTADDSSSLGIVDVWITGAELNFSDDNFLLRTAYFASLDVIESKNFGLELMSKGRLDFYLKEILLIMCIIDLSSNKLVGSIPEDIGRMNSLITLNLSNNHLSGAIPNSISNLHQLESMDLSHNSLTGEIPRELTKLTSLESFSVAYNNLSGPILGVEAQFSTFDNSSYEGNPNLCGPPMSKSCVVALDTTQLSLNEMSDDRRYEGTNFLIFFCSFCLFFMVSFWCFIVVLYFKRYWRYVLFTLVDRYGDMIYVKVVLSTRKIGAART
ncbi:cuscuta receptor 1-like [Carex rostrata]